jgi:hypothetical protein
MSTATNPQLVEFRDFLNAKIAAGPVNLSPEEALDEFRSQMTSEERAEALAAIRESLAEIESGSPGQCVFEFLKEIRSEFQLDK